jgi:hypothetical protein
MFAAAAFVFTAASGAASAAVVDGMIPREQVPAVAALFFGATDPSAVGIVRALGTLSLTSPAAVAAAPYAPELQARLPSLLAMAENPPSDPDALAAAAVKLRVAEKLLALPGAGALAGTPGREEVREAVRDLQAALSPAVRERHDRILAGAEAEIERAAAALQERAAAFPDAEEPAAEIPARSADPLPDRQAFRASMLTLNRARSRGDAAPRLAGIQGMTALALRTKMRMVAVFAVHALQSEYEEPGTDGLRPLEGLVEIAATPGLGQEAARDALISLDDPVAVSNAAKAFVLAPGRNPDAVRRVVRFLAETAPKSLAARRALWDIAASSDSSAAHWAAASALKRLG